MSEHVIVLGAGASVQAGGPTTGTFLDEAEKILKKAPLSDNDKRDFQLVFNGLAALENAHANAQLETTNIEAVFAAFEMAKLIGHLQDMKEEEVDRLPNAMRKMIQRTLEYCILFNQHKDGDRAFVPPPEPYQRFTALVDKLGTDDVSVITFNYDLCADYAFYYARTPITYCLDDKQNNYLKLLKLHGSLNWIRCVNCGKIDPWYMADYFNKYHWDFYSRNTLRLQMSVQFKDRPCCGQLAEEAMIVPPTWNKAQYHDQLGKVWRAAAQELLTAENIYVFGYSLPQSDYFFRYLYALGRTTKVRLKRFWVCDPVKAVEERFLGLLGPSARGRFDFFENNFDDALLSVAHRFNKQLDH